MNHSVRRDIESKVSRNERAKLRLLCRLLWKRRGVGDEAIDDSNLTRTVPTYRGRSDDELTRIVTTITESAAREVATSLLRANYSRSYVESVASTLYRLAGETPTRAFRAAVESNESARRIRSLKSDGLLTFTESEFESMLAEVKRRIMASRDVDGMTRNRSGLLFLYVFYLLAITGKRLSDACSVSPRDVRQLRERGVCAIRVQKTGKLGRMEIPEILNDFGTCFEAREMETCLSVFESWMERGALTIPFDRCAERRQLDHELTRLYESLFARPRPKGLSFHGLRRIYAGYKFLRGRTIAALQENLDHSSRTQTNRYVNVCLNELLNVR